MKSKKILVIAGILAIALLLVGCTPKAAAPTATPAPVVTEVPATAVPVTEVPATAVPVTEAPATAVPVTEAPATAVRAAPAPTEAAVLELTLEELAAFNGKNGARAYVAVDGIIYDVTDSAAWRNGDHNSFEAGNDLTVEIKTVSPHGIAKLANVVEVGIVKLAALELTLEELKAFNGKNGARAYVSVDGIIYDVTDSAAWKNGDHNSFEAGNDLTAEIKTVSPHGIAKLANVVEVGKLVVK